MYISIVDGGNDGIHYMFQCALRLWSIPPKVLITFFELLRRQLKYAQCWKTMCHNSLRTNEKRPLNARLKAKGNVSFYLSHIASHEPNNEMSLKWVLGWECIAFAWVASITMKKMWCRRWWLQNFGQNMSDRQVSSSCWCFVQYPSFGFVYIQWIYIENDKCFQTLEPPVNRRQTGNISTFYSKKISWKILLKCKRSQN